MLGWRYVFWRRRSRAEKLTYFALAVLYLGYFPVFVYRLLPLPVLVVLTLVLHSLCFGVASYWDRRWRCELDRTDRESDQEDSD